MINFTVAPNSPFAVGQNPQAIDQGDFNNDGNLDIITLNQESSNLSILLGDGTRDFGAASNFGTLPGFNESVSSISDLAVSDLNNDGNLDIVANYYNSPEGNNYAIFLGNGTGQFADPENFGLPLSPSSTIHTATFTVEALDYNQDGNQDLVFGSVHGNIIISLGDGQGGFSQNLFLDMGTQSREIVPRDLDQDGNLDLVVALGPLQSEITLIYGGGADNGVSIEPYEIVDGESEELIAGSIRDFVIEDFNNDGSLDFLAGGASELFLGLGDGEGGFLAPQVNQIDVLTEDTLLSTLDLESADFNLDGNADLILTAVNGTIMLYGDGEGNFTEEFRFDDPNFNDESENQNFVNEGQITVGDFNSDGIPDFATIDRVQSSNDVTVVLSEADDEEDNTEISDISVYRFLNTETQTQFYTTSEAEKEILENDLPQYELDGISFFGLSVPDAEEDSLIGISPVHRFFNTTTGIHLYTVDEAEKTFIEDNLTNFEYEGVPYYSYDTQEAGSIPLYRFYNENLGAHFYTPSIEERDFFIESPDYQIEGGGDGIAFYINPVE